MAEKYGLLIDYQWCTGCHSCEMACKVEHGWQAGEANGVMPVSYTHLFATPNYVLNERNSGTNAHSLCMRHKKPFVVVGPEHYCFALHGLVACAAPIIDQCDVSIGALTLTQPVPEGSFSEADKKVLVHAMSLVSSLATALSDQLRISGYNAQLVETESKYSQAALEAQRFESISRTVINTVKDGIVICDAAGTITLVTPEAAHLLKMPPEDLLGTGACTIMEDCLLYTSRCV